MIAAAARFVASLRSQSPFLEQALQDCVPAVGDFGLVYLVDGERLRCAAFAHATSTGRHLLRTLKHVYKLRRDDGDSTVAQVVRIGRPALRLQIRREQRPRVRPVLSPRVRPAPAPRRAFRAGRAYPWTRRRPRRAGTRLLRLAARLHP